MEYRAMPSDLQIRNKIVMRIMRIEKDKLQSIDAYLSTLENSTEPIQVKNDFSGIWADLDDSIVQEFTTNLISNRQKNRDRING